MVNCRQIPTGADRPSGRLVEFLDIGFAAELRDGFLSVEPDVFKFELCMVLLNRRELWIGPGEAAVRRCVRGFIYSIR